MKCEKIYKGILRVVYHYLLFFLLVAASVSITVSLFVGILSYDSGLVLNGENLSRAAKLSFCAVALLSLLITLTDAFRRRFTTEKIAGNIAQAMREVVRGNFGTRISKVNSLAIDDNFNEIIDCFNKMTEELGGLETLRTDFIADVSHEMKTPLSVIRNYATLLGKPELTEEERMEYANGITEASRKTADMITNVLKLNRLENQKIYPKTEAFDLGEQLCECLLQYESVWENNGIEIETDIAEGVTVSADSELLSHAWSNLFSNAFKFTQSGGTVFVSLTADAKYAYVTVRDTGCGMTPEVGGRIFEKFYQGDTSHAVRGNGLGLALVKRVIDILKGEISVESAVGLGSSFTVKIPREIA